MPADEVEETRYTLPKVTAMKSDYICYNNAKKLAKDLNSQNSVQQLPEAFTKWAKDNQQYIAKTKDIRFTILKPIQTYIYTLS